MEDQKLLERIALDPKIMAGKPVIKGTRLTIDYILNLLAHDAAYEEILDEYEGLTREDKQSIKRTGKIFIPDTLVSHFTRTCALLLI